MSAAVGRPQPGGTVTVRAPAKINLGLGVGAVRPDGFHTLATVYQAIGLYDEVAVAAAPGAATTLTVSGAGVDVSDVPTDATNLALRAAALLADHAGLDEAARTVAMTIRKRIPVAGGMAGGSADAAAALLACDTLWGLSTPPADLLRLAADLGSDVPFGLVGGTATGIGRGEVVSPVEDTGTYWWVVALPGGGLSTPAVYTELDRLRAAGGSAPPQTEPGRDQLEHLVTAVRHGDPVGLAAALGNDLQAAALSLRPKLAELLSLAHGGGSAPALAAVVSGSGPTCLFLAADEPAAARLRARVEAAGITCLVAAGPVPGARVVTAPVMR